MPIDLSSGLQTTDWIGLCVGVIALLTLAAVLAQWRWEIIWRRPKLQLQTNARLKRHNDRRSESLQKILIVNHDSTLIKNIGGSAAYITKVQAKTVRRNGERQAIKEPLSTVLYICEAGQISRESTESIPPPAWVGSDQKFYLYMDILLQTEVNDGNWEVDLVILYSNGKRTKRKLAFTVSHKF